jgi:hypothetical protein
MPYNLYRNIIGFLARAIAKGFLFIALSIGTPAVNSMRSIEERPPIVIVLENSRRSRDRGLIRAFGYHPEYKFMMYV